MAATDERAIHEFPTGTIDDNSLLIMDRPTATPGEYETEKFAIANLGLKLLGGIDFPSNLDTDEQDIFGAINEVNAKAMNIAREYDPNENWHKGDYCIHENITYICSIISGTTTGTFVPGDWTEVKVLEQVKANTGEINELKSNSEYHVGDTINISNLQLAGLITSGQKSIYIQLPLPKEIGTDVTAITLNANALFYIRHVSGGYILNNQTLTSIGTVTLKKNLSGIFIGVDMTNAFTSCPNNTPLVISTGEGANDYITFS